MSISRSRARGFTIVEFLVASGIGVLALGATAALWIYSSNSFAAMLQYVDLNNRSQNALDTLSQRIRRAQSVKEIDTDQLKLVDFDGVEIKWVYDDKKRTLTQTKSGQDDVLLTECDSLQFSCYQRTPIGGTYDQYPVATKDTTKVVQVQWTCSRKVYGSNNRTEAVRSAKVILRKI
jgi:type II secretory pathway pseudopilin PulG